MPAHEHAAAMASPVGLPVSASAEETAQLKAVPESKPIRQRILAAVGQLAEELDKSQPMSRMEIETAARRLLSGLDLSESYTGWTMVLLASAFWHDQVAAVPPGRRLLLLPRCLRDAEVCPARCDVEGLACKDCGACDLTDLRALALKQGYQVMIAEGSPAVMRTILSGRVDALLGVACLDALEKTLDKILLAGIPCMAVPLLGNGCTNTEADRDWVEDLIATPHRPAAVQTRTYLHLMRVAAQMFEPAQLERLVPRVRLATADESAMAAVSPLACTETIAHDFLAAGGKHSRPFITLAVFDALNGGHGTGAEGAAHAGRISDAVRRVALAIEIFHKASLVHDDIEDDDWFRYGQPTLHRTHGLATAINVGDYLIGLGYRLVAGERGELGGETTAEIVAQFASAHTRLCEGQGAELAWRDAADKRLTPLDALKIYALKTSPAFEAAILAGIRLAGPTDSYRESATRFARHLGVAYQILNDLDDWRATGPRERPSGADLLGGRPTILWALALVGLPEDDRRELESLVADPALHETTIARARQLYQKAGVFDQATSLVMKHHQRACEAAATVTIEPLRHLLHFLADAILDRRPLSISEQSPAANPGHEPH